MAGRLLALAYLLCVLAPAMSFAFADGVGATLSSRIEMLPGRGTAADNRLFVDAVVYGYRAGVPWRDLPERLLNELGTRTCPCFSEFP
jgi:hypothetical protein